MKTLLMPFLTHSLPTSFLHSTLDPPSLPFHPSLSIPPFPSFSFHRSLFIPHFLFLPFHPSISIPPFPLYTVHKSICLSVPFFLPSFFLHPSIHPFIHPSFNPFSQSIHLPAHLLPIHLINPSCIHYNKNGLLPLKFSSKLLTIPHSFFFWAGLLSTLVSLQ